MTTRRQFNIKALAAIAAPFVGVFTAASANEQAAPEFLFYKLIYKINQKQFITNLRQTMKTVIWDVRYEFNDNTTREFIKKRLAAYLNTHKPFLRHYNVVCNTLNNPASVIDDYNLIVDVSYALEYVSNVSNQKFYFLGKESLTFHDVAKEHD